MKTGYLFRVVGYGDETLMKSEVQADTIEVLWKQVWRKVNQYPDLINKRYRLFEFNSMGGGLTGGRLIETGVIGIN